MTTLFWLGTVCVALLTAHTAINARLFRHPDRQQSTIDFPVSILLPVRDEAHRVRQCLESVLAQRGVPRLDIIVLDDGSHDGTGDVIGQVAAGDPRLRLVTGADLPPGWLGKPHACHQLAALADPLSRVLVFIDADVVLAPDAIARAVETTITGGFDLVSPYPAIEAVSLGERLVQPLLQWSLLTFLPLRAMQRSRRTSLAAAGGQFLVLDRDGYQRAGGHAAIRAAVLDDVELARAIKRSGGRIALVNGSDIARCRMYTSWPEVVDGYSKSLWASFGSRGGAVLIVGLLLLYTAPVLVAVGAAAVGAWSVTLAASIAYVLGVGGRVLTAGATGGRRWPDAWTHPISIALLAWLVARSVRLHRRAQLRWKGRVIT